MAGNLGSERGCAVPSIIELGFELRSFGLFHNYTIPAHQSACPSLGLTTELPDENLSTKSSLEVSAEIKPRRGPLSIPQRGED